NITDRDVEPTVKIKQPGYYYTDPVQLKDTLNLDYDGDVLENIQVMLKGLGYDTGRTDGYFSKETKSAVESFQKDNDLKQTGEIDEETAGMIETKVVEHIREGKDDIQLEKAIETLYE